MARSAYLTFLDSLDLERIHEATLKIYRETGLVMHHPEALAIFKKHGAKIEGERVYIPKEVVDKALKTMPSNFKWVARNSDKNLQIGGADGVVGIHPNIGPLFVQDIENGRRHANLEDFRKCQIFTQESQVTNIVGACPVEPFEVNLEDRHLYMTYESIKHTDKPLASWTMTEERTEQGLDMVEIAMGKKGFMEDNVCVGAAVNPLSPLAWGSDALGTLMAFSKRNQAIWCPAGALAGVTAPSSIYGAIVQQNVEVLSGLILAQLVRPGSPVAYAASTTVADMRTCAFICGTPQMMMISNSCMQMGREYYHIPTRTMCGINESQEVDIQAGVETTQNVMGAILGGADLILETSGILSHIMVTSYEKMVIDDEIISRALCIKKGFDSSPEALFAAVDLIQKIGPGGSYLTHPSTVKNVRNNWMPSISDWKSNKREESEDILIRANRKFKELIARAPESLIDSELDKELLAYINQAPRY